MMMPRLDGISLAREIKSRADLPIIVLTAIDAADSKAELLDEVAEDYVTKPYHYPELRARINRCSGAWAIVCPASGSCWAPGSRWSWGGGGDRQRGGHLPHPDRVAPPVRARREPGSDRRDRDAAGSWLGRHRRRRPSYVWVTMRRLRQKIEPDANRPRHLVTVRGIGYRLEAEPT